MENDYPVTIRFATRHDIPAITNLERTCSTAAHWTEEQYRQAVSPASGDAERFVVVAEAASAAATTAQSRDPRPGIVGFLVALHLAPEWELENIVVAPAARRKGIGRQLLDALLSTARTTNSDSIFLEVRESNSAARKLYEAAGFQATGRRRSYYADPAEEAILYRRTLREAFSQ